MSSFLETIKERIVVFDGAMGTNLQVQNLSLDDFGGLRFEGCNEHLLITRPDAVAGQPRWIANPAAAGGKMLNPAAFTVPSAIRQGSEGRNDIAGIGLTPVDLTLMRAFPITERIAIQFRTDAFNVLNHPNVTNPSGAVQFGAAGLESLRMLNQSLGGLNPLFQEGGPRSLQASLKLTF